MSLNVTTGTVLWNT